MSEDKIKEWHKRKLKEFAESKKEPLSEEEKERIEENELEREVIERVKSGEMVLGSKLNPSTLIKQRILDNIVELEKHEKVLRKESEEDTQLFRESVTTFSGFLAQFREKLETALEEGKIESKDRFEKLIGFFEEQKVIQEKQNKTYNEILATVKKTEAKRASLLDKLGVEIKKMKAENREILAKNERILAENKKILVRNEKILRENRRKG